MGSTDTGLGPTDTGLGPTDTGLGPTDTGLGPTDTGLGPTDTGLWSTFHPAHSNLTLSSSDTLKYERWEGEGGGPFGTTL